MLVPERFSVRQSLASTEAQNFNHWAGRSRIDPPLSYNSLLHPHLLGGGHKDVNMLHVGDDHAVLTLTYTLFFPRGFHTHRYR
jgi:hypothetical protein